MVKTDLISAVAALEDYNFLRGDGTQYQPLGLRNWCLPANLITANSADQGSIANTDADLGKLETALTFANVKMLNAAWIFHPRTENYLRNLRGTDGVRAYPEMEKGMLRSKPYAITTNIPVNLGTGGNGSEIYLADFADVVIAEYPMLVESAANALYVDPLTGQQASAFTQDQTVFRIISQSDIGMRHQESIAVLTGFTCA
jgi:HK97 family phage major capsid protein